MMKKKFTVLLLIVCLCVAGMGCTRRACYEGLQEGQRRDCYKLPSQAEIQDCLDKVNAGTYDQYRKERETPDEQTRKAGDEELEPVIENKRPVHIMQDGYRRGY